MPARRRNVADPLRGGQGRRRRRYTLGAMYEGGRGDGRAEGAGSLYFFPTEKVSEEQARRWLREGPPAKRLWVISCLLRYAQWNDIWSYVTREEVRECFAELD